jgi:flagellar assembly protein FliH
MAVMSWIDQLKPLPPGANGMPAANSVQPAATIEQQYRDIENERIAILAGASQEAAAIREEAKIQAEALREAAWQEGYHSGQENARTVVEAELNAERAVYQQSIHDQLQAIVDGIAEARRVLWEQQEPDIVTFVLDMTRQVIKTEISQNPEIVTEVIKNAIRRVTDKENVRIRVSVADAPKIKAMREDILAMVDGLRNLEIIDDRRIGDGGCVIETNAGTIDAKIETQISEIERILEIEEHV